MTTPLEVRDVAFVAASLEYLEADSEDQLAELVLALKLSEAQAEYEKAVAK